MARTEALCMDVGTSGQGKHVFLPGRRQQGPSSLQPQIQVHPWEADKGRL